MTVPCCHTPFAGPEDLSADGFPCRDVDPASLCATGFSGCAGPEGTPCSSYLCGGVNTSCCTGDPDFPCFSGSQLAAYTNCLLAGWEPRCPSGCPEGICDDVSNTGACCTPLEECIDGMTAGECQGIGGQFRGIDSECASTICVTQSEPCRGPREPYYLDGDRAYSLDMCGVALGGVTKPLQTIQPAEPIPIGDEHGITLHETRNTMIPQQDEPCRKHFIALNMRADGVLEPMMCSDHWEFARYSRGFVAPNVGDVADEYGVEPGDWLFVVGAENPRLWQAVHHHTPLTCGVVA